MQERFASTLFAPSLQEHYTNATSIKDIMGWLLGDVTGMRVLEPAVGRGDLIDAIIGTPKFVDAVDVNKASLEFVSQKFPKIVRPHNADFIDLFVDNCLLRSSILSGEYDAIIGNPPYGLQMSKPYRRRIKSLYTHVYARESFGLFIEFSLYLLKRGGRYVFIIPDTFLHSKYHLPLRRTLLQRGKLSHIIQFKSTQFESVNFGYGNLCIIAGHSGGTAESDAVLWVDAVDQHAPIGPKLFTESAAIITGAELLSTAEEGWVHPARRESLEFSCDTLLLGELAECRTGFYSGENSRWIGFDDNLEKIRGKGHPIDWASSVETSRLTDSEKANGISGSRNYVPIIRGGHRAPFDETRWAVNWSPEAIDFYRTNRKARLQNSQFYFRAGLAIPMVTSGRISASLMQHAIFDQGVVGIFPKESSLIDFLLIYLNSNRVGKSIKLALNGSANNSANYVKRIPVPRIDADIEIRSKTLVTEAHHNCTWEQLQPERDEIVQLALNHQER